MDYNFQQLVRQHHNSTRLSHSIPHTTTCQCEPNPNHSILAGTISPHRSSNSRPVTEIGNREGATSASSGHPRILQLDVCQSKKEWGHSPSLQPEVSQSVFERPSLQDGKHQGSISYDQAERLSCFNRLVRCFLSRRSSPRLPCLFTDQPLMFPLLSMLPVL